MSALLERLENSGPADAYAELRQRARKALMSHGFPDLKTEAWKYTSLRVLDKRDFSGGFTAGEAPSLPFEADLIRISALDQGLPSLPDGLSLEPMPASALAELEYGGREDAFAWFNLARLSTAWRLRIERPLERPLALCFDTGAEFAGDWHPRLHIQLAEGASATLIDLQQDQGSGLMNLVQDIDLAAGSQLEHVIERQGHESAIVARTTVEVGKDASYRARLLDLGGRLHRQDLRIHLNDAGAHGEIDGLGLIDSKQHVDVHTCIDHRVGHTTSREAFRMLADGTGVGVFNGRIHIARGADDSHSDLNTANLLLSDSARINTKPELEIYAEDVTASHGATIGQLDEDAVFYLRSRGVPLDQAASLLKRGFARLPVDAVADEAVRDWLGETLDRRL